MELSTHRRSENRIRQGRCARFYDPNGSYNKIIALYIIFREYIVISTRVRTYTIALEIDPLLQELLAAFSSSTAAAAARPNQTACTNHNIPSTLYNTAVFDLWTGQQSGHIVLLCNNIIYIVYSILNYMCNDVRQSGRRTAENKLQHAPWYQLYTALVYYLL